MEEYQQTQSAGAEAITTLNASMAPGDEPTQLIGDYQILGKLGSGGMGVVYRARKKGTNFDVALKVLPDAFASDENCRKRLRQEANAASKLTHVNLVSVFENSEEENAFIAMELVQGQSLAQILEETGTLSIEQFQDIFAQVCDGLLHAHAKGVVHRDIKPGNLLVNSEGIVKIADFGIARTLESFDPNPQMTGTNTVTGTPEYMSPEQCLGTTLDVRSDIYSLGAVMFRALTGREVFEGKNPIHVIAKHLHEAPPSVCDTNSSIPRPLAEIVLRCLQKDPVHRYQDVAQVLLALKHANSKPKGRLPLKYRLQLRTRKPAQLAVAGILVAVALCFFGALQLTKSASTLGLPVQARVVNNDLQKSAKGLAEIEAEIRQWKLDLVATENPSEKILYGRWIGSAYMTLAFPSPESYGAPTDAQRKSFLLNAVKFFGEAEQLQMEVDPNDLVLDDIYDQLQSASYYLDSPSNSLKYSRARAKFLERSPEIMNESLVRCYNDMASSMTLLHYERKSILDAYRKAIYFDKIVSGTRIGDYALPAYLDLIYELEQSGEFSEALVLVNEKIQRESARYGSDDSNLRNTYETKAKLLDCMKRYSESSKVRDQIKQLKPT